MSSLLASSHYVYVAWICWLLGHHYWLHPDITTALRTNGSVRTVGAVIDFRLLSATHATLNRVSLDYKPLDSMENIEISWTMKGQKKKLIMSHKSKEIVWPIIINNNSNNPIGLHSCKALDLYSEIARFKCRPRHLP